MRDMECFLIQMTSAHIKAFDQEEKRALGVFIVIELITIGLSRTANSQVYAPVARAHRQAAIR